jgi:hypothetical protein
MLLPFLSLFFSKVAHDKRGKTLAAVLLESSL